LSDGLFGDESHKFVWLGPAEAGLRDIEPYGAPQKLDRLLR